MVSAREQRTLATVVETEVTRLGVNPTLAVRVLALDYGRIVWRALKQTEPKPKKKLGRPPKTPKQRLEETRARIREIAPRVLPVRTLKQIEGKVVALFEDVQRFEKTVE